MKLNVIDLFAGCGGLTDGFLQTRKYNTLAVVDWELATVKTIRNRLSSKWGYDLSNDLVVFFDIQRTSELLNGFNCDRYGAHEGLIKLVGDNKVDIIIGGPPCQAYSVAKRNAELDNFHDDYRNFLFESYVKMVSHFQPESFVFENVEGILSSKPGGIPITKRIFDAFSEIGYEITENIRQDALFDISEYGVPQKRKRVIIYGVKKSITSHREISDFYELMKSKKQDSLLKVGSCFENIPKIYPITSTFKVRKSHTAILNGCKLPFNHEPRFHNKRDVEIFRILASDIEFGVNKYTSTEALIELYEQKTGKKSKFHKYHVIRRDKPSNTIPAHLYKDGLRHIHPDPEQARSITVREAARIQSFDDDFEFIGSRGDTYKMVGNAVPPGFAKVIAEVVAEII